MMFEEMHTYRHTRTTQITQNVVFCSIFARNWMLEKVMIQTGVQFNLCRASKVSYFTACSREIYPACPTNTPSITHKSCDGVKEMMIQVGGHVNPRSDDLNRGAINLCKKSKK